MLNKRAIKRVWLIVAAMIILFAMVQAALHLLGGLVGPYRGKIEQIASQVLGRPVAMQAISIIWRGFSPIIHIDDVTMLDVDGEQPVVHLDQLEIQISLLNSLLRRQIVPGYIVISGAQLQAKQTQPNQLQLTSFSIPSNSAEVDPHASLDSHGIIAWLMQQSAIVVRDLTVTFEDDVGERTTVKDLHFTFHQYLNHRYRIQGQFTVDQTIPTQIDFNATLRNHPPLSFRWSGEVYVQANQLLLEQWLPEAQGLPKDWQRIYETLQGQADVTLWAQLTDNEIDSAQLEFQVHDLIAEQDGQSTSLLDQGSGTLFYERLTQGWSLTGYEIDWDQMSPLTFSYEKTADQYQLQIPYVDLKSLTPWVMTQDHLALWRQWQPTGVFRQLTAQWVMPLDESITHWQVSTRFEQLGWQAVDLIAGVENLQGQLQWTPEKLLLQLDSEQTILSAPAWLDAPIQLTQLQADVDWQRSATGWNLSVQHPLITTDWMILQGEHWRIRQQDDEIGPEWDVHAQLVKLAAAQLGQILPRPLLPASLYDYLANFAQAGFASGDLWLQGRLQDYPFSNNEGELLVDVQVSDVDLIYFEGWPKAEGLNGQLIFHNNQMIGRVDSGTTVQNPMDGIQVVLDDLGGRDILTFQGQLPLEPGAAMNFVQASPLAEDLAMLKHLETYGALELDLLARIEFIGNEEIELEVDGKLNFANNQIDFPQWPVDLTDVSGQVNFDENGVVDSHLYAKLWEQPLTLTLTTQSVDSGYMVLADIEGQLNFDQLALSAPWPQLVTGQTDYQAQFKFYSDETAQHQFHWTSNLVGIGVRLPQPFHKTDHLPKPVEITTSFTLDHPIDLHFHITDLLSGRALIEPTDTGAHLPRGEITFNTPSANLPEQNGWRFTGYLPTLSISEWQEWVAKHFTDEAASAITLSTELDLIDVTIGELEWMHNTWNDLNIQVRHAPPVWRIDLASKQVEGDIYITDHYANGLRIKLDHLYLPEIIASPASDWNLTPTDLPPIDLVIDDLYYNNHYVGHVRLQTEVDSDANELTVKELDIRSSLAALVLSGSWREQAQQSTTHVKGTLTSTQFTQFLHIIKPKSMLESKMAKIEFDFTWPDKPTQFALAQTEGDFKFRFERGRLVGLERAMEDKVGLGKMLNILSFQSFWRRLALDFDDLTQKGLGFNLLQGRTHLADGVMSTRDTSLNGSVVYIAAQGDVNLADETYDLTLRVVPYLTGSLPILAAFVVNPLIGAATFVADQLVSLGRREVGGTVYQVTGSWDEPQIKTK